MQVEIRHKFRKSIATLKFGIVPSLLILGLILGGRWAGAFQYLEWQALDAYLNVQPPETEDKRILLVNIDENTLRSVGRYPIPDHQLVKLLKTLQRHQPRAIGLDLFRDLPVDPGSTELAAAFQTMDNLYGIDKVLPPTVDPPPSLPPDRLGFADAPIDLDSRQRRVLLGTQTQDGFRFSLSLLLAETYLAAQNIQLENGIQDPSTMRFRSTELPRIDPNFGGYTRTNTGSGDLQLLLNFRKGPHALRVVSFQDMIAGNFSPDWVKNRVVIIGVTTLSVQDHIPAAVPSVIDPQAGWVYGIEIHGHAVSQILSATLDQRPLIRSWPDWAEYGLIVVWGLIGLMLAAYLRSPRNTLVAIALCTLLITATGYFALLWGWWLPVVPTLSSFLLISLSIDAFYQYERFIQTKLKAQREAVHILEQAKADLEIQVAQRTSELQQSNVELSQAKEIAEMASHAKGTFLAKMSHELRTPLNAILGFSQMMAQDNTLSPTNHKRTRSINQSGEHLLGLINDILSLAKLESGQQKLQAAPFNLSTLLETIESIFRLRIEQKGLTFLIEISPNLPPYLIGDAQKLRQVLINLLSNALKFTQAGQIILRVKSLPSTDVLTLQFEVEDTGVGIVPSEHHKLFIPFAQTDSGERSKTGTGLGLPISEQFAHLMGGTLTVSSQVGIGTVFTFTAQVKIVEIEHEAGLQQTAADESSRSPEPHLIDQTDTAASGPTVSQSEICQTLSTMPSDWLQELHHAASRLQGKQVIQLLEHIPAEHAIVCQPLIDWAENYEYAKITEMIDPLLQP